MKKALAATLTTIILLSTLSFALLASESVNPADSCWDNWEKCRERAFESDYGPVRTTLALTVCDIALAKCLLNAK